RDACVGRRASALGRTRRCGTATSTDAFRRLSPIPRRRWHSAAVGEMHAGGPTAIARGKNESGDSRRWQRMSTLPAESEPDHYRRPAGDVLLQLESSEAGLDDEEARKRLARYGRNELTARKPIPAWRKFLAQFQDVLVILLLIATAISFALWLIERESDLPYDA